MVASPSRRCSAELRLDHTATSHADRAGLGGAARRRAVRLDLRLACRGWGAIGSMASGLATTMATATTRWRFLRRGRLGALLATVMVLVHPRPAHGADDGAVSGGARLRVVIGGRHARGDPRWARCPGSRSCRPWSRAARPSLHGRHHSHARYEAARGQVTFTVELDERHLDPLAGSMTSSPPRCPTR